MSQKTASEERKSFILRKTAVPMIQIPQPADLMDIIIKSFNSVLNVHGVKTHGSNFCT